MSRARAMRVRAAVLAAVAVIGSVVGGFSHAETLEWRQVPISIVLPVGQERVIAFPDAVQVGVPSSLPPELFRTQSTGGTALWLARGAFGPQRLEVRLLTTGHVMLFDVTAVESPSAAAEPIEIRVPEHDPRTPVPGGPIGPVELTRFAAQQLYAPARVLRDLPGVRRVPMGAPQALALYRDDLVIAQPLASWQRDGLVVTAVKLTRTGPERLILDPRQLRGRFVSATFQHNSLGPAGSRSDTTCVYLVTEGPFMASVAGAVPPAPAHGVR